MRFGRLGRLTSITATVIFLSMIGLMIWNWDVTVRFAGYYQKGVLTYAQIRRDLASFDFGKSSSVKPAGVKISPLDGMTQVYVPEGEFRMGIGAVRESSNSPQHAVYLDAYWIDQVEVSNAIYIKCMRAGDCTRPASDNVQFDKWTYRNHPITYVTWFQAEAYCQWAKRRLPTEAEWEKAVREQMTTLNIPGAINFLILRWQTLMDLVFMNLSRCIDIHRLPAHMECSTCRGMFGNGWQIGTVRSITQSRRIVTPGDRIPAPNASCGADLTMRISGRSVFFRVSSIGLNPRG